MKKLLFLFLILLASTRGECYQPTAENLRNRVWFENARFGMFIHWGPSSILGANEWVMNKRNIKVEDYKRLMRIFNPIFFDAQKWVSLAKNSGVQYITFVTRHHDGFSNWDTEVSDWKITNTPYGKDIFKMLAEECRHQGIKLFVYYSLLDWSRNDYPYDTGRTGKGTGRTENSDYPHYLQFMKDQLTELLTNFGEISGVWFDGHWDQTLPEGSEDRSSWIDWHYEEIYNLIHTLQPHCLIGNNHHLFPFPGEDFQMFEKDLPGENNSGWNYQEVSNKLPLETCETINDSWGFNITDDQYKSPKELIILLVRAAGHGTNLLLNIGPMPNGEIQPEFQERLMAIGEWMKRHACTIHNTKAGFIKPQDWGAITQKEDRVYIHLLKIDNDLLTIPFPYQIQSVVTYIDKNPVSYQLKDGQLSLRTASLDADALDVVIEVQIKK